MSDTLIGDIKRGITNRYPPCCVLAYCWLVHVREVPPGLHLGTVESGTCRAHVPCGIFHAPEQVWAGPERGWADTDEDFYDYDRWMDKMIAAEEMTS